MSEKQKEVLATIMDAVPNLSEFQKGRLYGMAEAMEEKNRKEEANERESANETGRD